MGVCPHCNEEIDEVRYSANQRVYGTVALRHNGSPSYNYSDSGDTMDYAYECPECDFEFDDEESAMAALRATFPDEDEEAAAISENAWSTLTPAPRPQAPNAKGVSLWKSAPTTPTS